MFLENVHWISELKNLCEVYYSLKEDIEFYGEREKNVFLGRVKKSVYIDHIKKNLKNSISFNFKLSFIFVFISPPRLNLCQPVLILLFLPFANSSNSCHPFQSFHHLHPKWLFLGSDNDRHNNIRRHYLARPQRDY